MPNKPHPDLPKANTNVRGRFGPEDLGRIERPNLKGLIMKQHTIHKSIMAFIASTVALLAAFSIPVPEFFQGEAVSWFSGIIAAIAGGGITGWLTWLIPNKPIPNK